MITIVKICPFCGSMFEYENSRGKTKTYCNVKCRNATRTARYESRYKKTKPPILRQCATCQTEFRPNGRQKWCSDKCKNRPHVHVCECGKTFETHRSYHKWCSRKCYKRFEKVRSATRTTSCCICGVEMFTKCERRKTCGRRRCVDENRRQQTKRYHDTRQHIENSKKHRSKYPLWYVRSVLVRRSWLSAADIPDELVRLKQIQLKLTRELKNENSATT